MKKSSPFFIPIALLIFSCHVYKQYDKESFPNYVWKAGQEIKFNPTIDDISETYSLTLGIRHLFGFQPRGIRVSVRSVSPSGKEISKEYELKIKDSEGEYLSKCGGDLCDLETMVDSKIKFEEAGAYTFSITPDFQDDKIAGVMEVGLILDVVD